MTIEPYFIGYVELQFEEHFFHRPLAALSGTVRICGDIVLVLFSN